MIRVLVVEDDPIAADAHAAYVGRVPGFTVAGVALNAADALRRMSRTDVDLVLLDMHLPDLHGLDVCRRMRAHGHHADVVAVTSARDLNTVRSAVSLGIVQYLIKPFVFATFAEKLEQYAAYRSRVAGGGVMSGQHEVDRALAVLHGRGQTGLPKGMSPESLDAVTAALRDTAAAVSASELAEDLGMSRITARRYLEHLTDAGLASRAARYGRAGRPELEYRWVG
ncbi:response regulator [Cryptosporangium aurantiacum]|uniref:Transcriptional regulatory protein n=1 Tax=Cryptosporangium aurantiacum TaxID=134849 RepID=A0A1M7RLD7_9ACTN|nr:response regulator [Cryptosporangium aurantiacum]SHN47135.1 Response regulator of citrate/malate metabolism [Cryptosporangium aurantiacum]